MESGSAVVQDAPIRITARHVANVPAYTTPSGWYVKCIIPKINAQPAASRTYSFSPGAPGLNMDEAQRLSLCFCRDRDETEERGITILGPLTLNIGELKQKGLVQSVKHGRDAAKVWRKDSCL